MTTSTRTGARAPGETRAGRREWAGLGVLALPALLASLELTVTHLALPSIGRDLGANSTQLLWIVDIYAFLLAGSLLTMGALGDRIGRRRLLLLGAAGYGVASVLAAYAPSATMLIAARALMGVAGATLMPSILALVAVMFTDPRQRTTAIGIVVAAVSGGTAIGPLAGGWLLERLWWGSAFLLGVPVMALLLVIGPILLPERRAPGPGRLDLTGVLLSLAAVLPVVYGLKRIAAEGAAPGSAAAVLVGLVMAGIFVRRQRRLADPLVDLRLFADRAFAVAVVTLFLGIFVLWGSNYAIAQYLQLVRGLSPLEAGLWTAPSAVGVIAGSMLAPRIVRRVGPGRVIGAGLVISAIGYGVLAGVEVAGGLVVLVAGSVVVSAGLGPMMALATDIVVGSAPPERAGAASAISSTAPQLGGALGIAVLGSVITAVYRDRMAAAVPAARDNLTAAVAATADLPAPAGARLLETARAAFTQGFQLTAAISAALMIVIAVAVIAFLRDPDD
ncbi:MFS transporter, DHA2 family, multidrug resistance protein [Thermomonospora echinospora]|uniref:MFS transporter, DHA2 family, multidrug resistance protein n=1 Tax=Thermomonospora echinospora TaxID=1992 RepID=A0A1H6AFA6_9ACTN|nr:MFS transporter [Thermomonospora echinospora]SEG47181.1 MFS transporter, DHA2 family, multidrug resistance protein [Thermomonospora echinospora]